MIFEEETSRRTVVKTGAKLAYAAPLVAASFKLSAGGAGAVSDPTGGNCSGDFVCLQNEPKACGNNDWGTCYCFATAENTGQCGSNEACANLSDCTKTSDCPSGYHCAVNTCCQKPVCIEDCAQTQSRSNRTQSQGGTTPSGR